MFAFFFNTNIYIWQQLQEKNLNYITSNYKYSQYGTLPGELRKENAKSAYLVNSIQK